jgi:hypothetical protein
VRADHEQVGGPGFRGANDPFVCRHVPNDSSRETHARVAHRAREAIELDERDGHRAVLSRARCGVAALPSRGDRCVEHGPDQLDLRVRLPSQLSRVMRRQRQAALPWLDGNQDSL